MSTRNTQIDNINSALQSLPADILPLASDLFTRIQSLNVFLSAMENHITTESPMVANLNDDGVWDVIPNPVINTYNHTVNTYNSTVREFFDIKDKHALTADPFPRQSRSRQAIAFFVLVVAGLISFLL